MHIYQKIYEFNLLDAYGHLTLDVRSEFQSACDWTLGKALKSLVLELGQEHEVIGKLKKMIEGELPDSADDFKKDKWFQE
jgi:hypothetical protein